VEIAALRKGLLRQENRKEGRGFVSTDLDDPVLTAIIAMIPTAKARCRMANDCSFKVGSIVDTRQLRKCALFIRLKWAF
jgi:hypothetical protein